MITDNSFDVLCLTETWLKPNYYIGLNESTPPSYCYKHEPRQTGRGGGVATIYSDILSVTQKTGYRFNLFEILMLNVTLSDIQKKSVLSLALATVYRPPGPYTDFLKEFADFLSDLLVNADKALIVGDFNIHVDNPNDALGLAFTDLINSFGVKQNVTGPTHRYNHTLDLIISHGIDLTDIDIVPQSDDVTDHFLVSCMLHITDINYMAPRYRPGRTIVPATKDRFTNNLPDLSQLLCVPINTNELDKMTSNMGTILSNTLETVAPHCSGVGPGGAWGSGGALPPGWGYGWAWGAWVLVGVPPGAWVGACAWARLWCGGLRCIGASAGGGGGSNRGGVNGLYLGVLLSFVVWELTE